MTPTKNNKELTCTNAKAGSIGYEYEPRLITDLHPNTELGVDVKFLTLQPGRMPVGKSIRCICTRDAEYHYTVVECCQQQLNKAMAGPPKKTYPYPYKGELISFTKRDDGTLRVHFKDFEISPTLTVTQVSQLADDIKREFIKGYPGLVEKKS